MKNKTLWTTLLLLCLLPAATLGVTEGVVEAAPDVEMAEIASQEVSYLPDESYYAGYGDWFPVWENAEGWVESKFDGECYHDVEQRPRMTAGESLRAEKLLSDYKAGRIAYTGESILNKMEDVIVGVYALDPADYAGEKAFVILPGPCMTDEQILAVIDAYNQLGLTFDPYALSARNCARGGGIETNRFLGEEERDRYSTLARLIEHGLLDVTAAGEIRAIQPKLDSRYFCGLPDFTIRPYRAATDEEFVAMLVDMGYHDMTGEIDHDAVEKQARRVLNALDAPLSMGLEHVFNDGGYVPVVFDVQGRQAWDSEGRRSYGAMFSWITAEGYKTYAQVMYDWETKELVSAHWANQRDWDANPGPSVMNISDEDVLSAAKDAEQMIALTNPTWHLQDEVIHNDWGACRMARTQVEEDIWLTVFVGGDDGKVHGFEIQRGDTVGALPADDMPVNG
ncbi:MAG: hypothetical protein IKK34_11905 [Clostridia bacterium]|nr:hypothetical protein [Clostridia bacterium]